MHATQPYPTRDRRSRNAYLESLLAPIALALAHVVPLVLCAIVSAQAWTEVPGSGRVAGGGFAAFDAARQATVYASPGAVTSVFDGTTVTNAGALVYPSYSNAFHYLRNLTYDPGTQKVVGLIASRPNAAGVTTVTLTLAEWDGLTWQYRTIPAFSSNYLYGFFTIYDPVQQKLLAYTDGQSVGTGETFHIDTVQSPPVITSLGTGPWRGIAQALVQDPSTSSITLLAGINGVLRAYRWTGSTWSQQFPTWPFLVFPNPLTTVGSNFAGSTAPSGAMCFRYNADLSTGSVVPRTVRLAGGAASEAFLSQYPPEDNYALTWDFIRGCFYAFGDFTPNVWKLDLGPDAQASTLGAGCSGSRGTPTLAPQQGSTPRIGTTFVLQSLNLPLSGHVFLALGASDTLYGPTPLPLNLAPLGAPQCNLLVSIDNLFPTSNILGAATWGFTIPNIPGGVFFTQTVVFDPPANAFGVTLSNAVRGVVGS